MYHGNVLKYMLFGWQWEVRKEAALSAIVGQQKEKEAVEAENAANSAKLAENRAHVRTPSYLCSCTQACPKRQHRQYLLCMIVKSPHHDICDIFALRLWVLAEKTDTRQ